MPNRFAPLERLQIKTRQLVLLAHLDRERSVLHAAEAVGMSQPAASKLLHELESALGVPLFERHARGVEPTVYGTVLLRHAHSVLAEMQRAQEEIDALQRGESFRVAIGCVMSPATDLLPRALGLLVQRHPRMVVSVETDTSRPMVAKLHEGRFDIVVGRILDTEGAEDLAFEALADEPHSLIAREGHPLLERARLQLDDLVDLTWILPPRESVLRERINAMFLQRGLTLPRRIVETASVPLITNLLRSSDMVVALPAEVVRPYCDAGMLRVLPIEIHVRMDSFGFITRRHHPLSPHAREALGALRDAADEVYRGRKRR